MKGFATLASAAVLAVAVSGFAASANAAVIAQFSPDTNANDYVWTQSAGGTGGEFTSAGTNGPAIGCTTCVATHFSFLDPSLAALAFLPATFKIDAIAAEGNPAALNSAGVYAQPGLNGNFSFVYYDKSQAVGSTQTVGGVTLTNGVTNLLSGVFTGAWIQGAGGSGSTNLAIANGGHLTLASDVYAFQNVDLTSEEFAFNLLGVTPNFGATPGSSLNSFKANGGGNFSATVLGVPEASTWALMIMGFGGVGAMVRSRRRAVGVA